jgi:hypothetical protein
MSPSVFVCLCDFESYRPVPLEIARRLPLVPHATSFISRLFRDETDRRCDATPQIAAGS